jgi:CMP-N-acetylneuraminic acid synthetase
MTTLTALLPMKAHSDRVPGKNMRIFADSPLYRHIASLLESSPYINAIVIDTDSEIIAQDASEHFSKVKIIERPLELRGDMVSMNAIIGHDIAHCACEHFLQTHSTNPLLTRETIERAIEDYFDSLNMHDSLFSVTRIQSRLYWSSGEPLNHNIHELIRTQDLPPLFEENSNFYLFSRSSFRETGRRIGKRPKMFSMNKLEAIDIDEEEDFRLAETLFLMRKKTQGERT